MVDPVPIRPSRRDQTREERLEVLRLLEEGTITADEAAALLDALDRAERAAGPPPTDGASPRGAQARQVRIRVTDSRTGRATVNLAFPLGLIKSGLDIAGQFVPEYLPKADAIRESITAGFRGALVDVDDGGQRVEIIAE